MLTRDTIERKLNSEIKAPFSLFFRSLISLISFLVFSFCLISSFLGKIFHLELFEWIWKVLLFRQTPANCIYCRHAINSPRHLPHEKSQFGR